MPSQSPSALPPSRPAFRYSEPPCLSGALRLFLRRRANREPNRNRGPGPNGRRPAPPENPQALRRTPCRQTAEPHHARCHGAQKGMLSPRNSAPTIPRPRLGTNSAQRAVGPISLCHLSPIGIENGGRLLHLIDNTGYLLEFADGGLCRLNACGDSFNLTGEHIGVLAIDARFHQRLNLGFDPIQLHAHEFGILARFLVVPQAQLLYRHAIFERVFEALLLCCCAV